jgi:hypothetical protein
MGGSRLTMDLLPRTSSKRSDSTGLDLPDEVQPFWRLRRVEHITIAFATIRQNSMYRIGQRRINR